MNSEANISAIQAALVEAGFDGWLFYDHHHRDPIAAHILALWGNRVYLIDENNGRGILLGFCKDFP